MLSRIVKAMFWGLDYGKRGARYARGRGLWRAARYSSGKSTKNRRASMDQASGPGFSKENSHLASRGPDFDKKLLTYFVFTQCYDC